MSTNRVLMTMHADSTTSMGRTMNNNQRHWLYITIVCFGLLVYSFIVRLSAGDAARSSTHTKVLELEKQIQTTQEMERNFAEADRKRVEKAVKERDKQMHELKTEIRHLHGMQP